MEGFDSVKPRSCMWAQAGAQYLPWAPMCLQAGNSLSSINTTYPPLAEPTPLCLHSNQLACVASWPSFYLCLVKTRRKFCGYSKHIQLLLFILLLCLLQSFWIWFWLFYPLPVWMIRFNVSHFCSKGRMTVLLVGVGTGHKSCERDPPEVSPKPSLKEKYRRNSRPFA